MDTWIWIGFTVGVLALLALDLGVFQRTAHAVPVRAALLGSGLWIGLALLFNVGILILRGPQAGVEFLTGYLIEWSLSVDNLFVFLLIFSYFAIPAAYQHRVLFWGILGALLMRAAMILLGLTLIATFHWVIYLFGGLLLVSALKLARQPEQPVDLGRSPLLRLLRRGIPLTDRYDGARFVTRHQGRWAITPLFAALLLIESADLLFALDSIPAIFAITTDPFLVYTSNVCAILGLRALYFALAGILTRFHYLRAGLVIILGFVGVKMLLSEFYPIPATLSLGVVVAVLLGAVLASRRWPRPAPSAAASAPAETGHAEDLLPEFHGCVPGLLPPKAIIEGRE